MRWEIPTSLNRLLTFPNVRTTWSLRDWGLDRLLQDCIDHFLLHAFPLRPAPVRAMIGCPSSNSVGLTTRLTIGAKRAGSRNFQKLQKNCSQMTLSSLLFPFSSRILQRHILSFRILTFLLLAFFKVYLVHVEGHQEWFKDSRIQSIQTSCRTTVYSGPKWFIFESYLSHIWPRCFSRRRISHGHLRLRAICASDLCSNSKRLRRMDSSSTFASWKLIKLSAICWVTHSSTDVQLYNIYIYIVLVYQIIVQYFIVDFPCRGSCFQMGSALFLHDINIQ